MSDKTTERDYSAPPRTEFEGREYEVSLTFCCPNDLTEDQLWEWLQFEWGYGSIASDHSGHGAQINRVNITDLRTTHRLHYVDWGPKSKDGKCSGRGRIEYEDQPKQLEPISTRDSREPNKQRETNK